MTTFKEVLEIYPTEDDTDVFRWFCKYNNRIQQALEIADKLQRKQFSNDMRRNCNIAIVNNPKTEFTYEEFFGIISEQIIKECEDDTKV